MNDPLYDWTSQLDRWLAALQEMRIPGGCDSCHAFHTVATEDEHVSRVTVHHADDCPTLRRMRLAGGCA